MIVSAGCRPSRPALNIAQTPEADDAHADRRCRDTVAGAAKTAEKALRELLAAGQAHDQLVRETAATLVAAGLLAVDDFGRDNETGGTAAKVGSVRIRGAWHTPVRSDSLLMRVVHGTAAAVFGARHDLARRLNRYPGAVERETRPDGLLDAALLPAPYQSPPVPMPAPPVLPGTTVLMSDDAKEQHRLERQKATYSRERATLVAERGEEHVRALELRTFHDGQPHATTA